MYTVSQYRAHVAMVAPANNHELPRGANSACESARHTREKGHTNKPRAPSLVQTLFLRETPTIGRGSTTAASGECMERHRIDRTSAQWERRRWQVQGGPGTSAPTGSAGGRETISKRVAARPSRHEWQGRPMAWATATRAGRGSTNRLGWFVHGHDPISKRVAG